MVVHAAKNVAAVAALLVSGVAMAEDTKVSTAADSAKVGAEFRTELNYNDHGLHSTKDHEADSTTELQVQAVKVKLSGNLNPKTEYKFRFNLLNPGKSPLEYGFGTHWFSDMIGMGIGKQKVLQGGHDNADNNYRSHAVGVYKKNLAFDAYMPMISAHIKAAGKITLQIFDDVTTANNGEWNKTAHPTYVIGWAGDFGGISPLLNIGTYDNQKSRWIDVGVKAAVAGVNAALDVKMDTISHKVPDGDKSKSKEDTATSMTLRLGYEIKKTATPWLYYSTYEKKQYEDKDAGKEDAKFNSSGFNADGNWEYEWDDNGSVWGIGADLHMMGDNWTPYVAIVSHSGKFADDEDPSKEKSKSQMEFKLGCLGEI